MTSLTFEVLGPRHDRSGFTCGVEPLDRWLRTQATQDQRRHIAQVFVAVRGSEVVGFYSLNMFTLAIDDLPEPLRKKLPRYEAMPAALIGRLGRATSEAGTGLGSLLLADALSRVLDAAAEIAVYAVVVDAKDERAKRFYEAHGFMPFVSKPRRLFLPLQTVEAARRSGTSK